LALREAVSADDDDDDEVVVSPRARKKRPATMKPEPIHHAAGRGSEKRRWPRRALEKKLVAEFTTVAVTDDERFIDLTNRFHMTMLHTKIMPKQPARSAGPAYSSTISPAVEVEVEVENAPQI
jgi:hypothetical protein